MRFSCVKQLTNRAYRSKKNRPLDPHSFHHWDISFRAIRIRCIEIGNVCRGSRESSNIRLHLDDVTSKFLDDHTDRRRTESVATRNSCQWTLQHNWIVINGKFFNLTTFSNPIANCRTVKAGAVIRANKVRTSASVHARIAATFIHINFAMSTSPTFYFYLNELLKIVNKGMIQL